MNLSPKANPKAEPQDVTRPRPKLRYSDLLLIVFTALTGGFFWLPELVTAKIIQWWQAIVGFIMAAIFAAIWLKHRKREELKICDRCKEKDQTFNS